ncbi:MAG TPA: hypothetical protein VMX96_00345 [Dehalococcoidia bacterium]|nr:hypothetical protein [Dehalococcoidia bacterium]
MRIFVYHGSIEDLEIFSCEESAERSLVEDFRRGKISDIDNLVIIKGEKIEPEVLISV